MKKIILSITSLVTLVCFGQTDVKLNIRHLFNSNNLDFATVYSTPNGEDIKISRLEYYISGVKFLHDGGMETEATDVFLLVNAENGVDFPIGNYNITNLESIEFGVGVIEGANHLDPSLYAADHALAPQMNSMHWGWASGYRFIALEGLTGSDFTTTYQFHALGDQNFYTQTISTTGTTTGSELVINLDADYFNGFNLISVADGPIEHGVTETGCLSLIDNFKNSVFSERAADPVGIVETENSFELYPNPTTNILHLNSVNDKDLTELKLQYQVFDVLGRQILADELNNSTISVDDLNGGLYFIELNKEGKLFGRQSFLVKE